MNDTCVDCGQMTCPPGCPSRLEETLVDKCRRLEFYKTPEWAARAILKKEILTHRVLDPACGDGVLCKAAIESGYDVSANDIENWGYDAGFNRQFKADFLKDGFTSFKDETIFMNPPFSLAQDFVDKAFKLGARKIVCFQRFAWWESAKRQEWWQKRPPNRIYICSDRADCWRGDLQPNEKGQYIDPDTGKVMNGTPTAHAFFVWEVGHPPGTVIGHISKKDV